jgi:HupE / UreJ protein
MISRTPMALWRWLAWLVCGVWLAGPGSLHAHSSGNSYLAFSLREDRPVLRVDLSMRDLDMVFDLDGDRNGEVTWGEARAREKEIWPWLAAGLGLDVDGQPCTLSPIDALASERSDGVYLSTEWGIDCPDARTQPPAGLRLRYGLMFSLDHLHRGLLKVDLPGQASSFVLSPEQPVALLLATETRAAEVLWRYVVEGVWHIWIGIDHVLFLLGLLVLAPVATVRGRMMAWQPIDRWRSAAGDVVGVVTAFTVAHSITLVLSVMQWVVPPARWVEPLIALSVVLAALNNLLGWFSLRRWRLAFAFGLIHGFGFASVLLDLGLPAHALALALAGFNLGVELGQLAIVAAFLALAWPLRHTAFYRWCVVVGGSLAIAVAGLAWTWERLGF